MMVPFFKLKKKQHIVVVVSLLFVSFFSLSAQEYYKVNADSILTFDFEGLQIGIAEYENGPTGTTVFYFPDGVMGAADIRGGATGTVNAHVVTRGYERKMIQAITFSGGSWYGLSAATGVANEIKDLKAKEGNHNFIAGVLGGIINDVGGRRFSRITPDDALGRKALLASKPNWFPLGAHGAGRFAMQGFYYSQEKNDKEAHFGRWPHSGQGAAFGQIGKTKVAVFTVVNALGAIVDRDGDLVRCYRNAIEQDCGSIKDLIATSELIQDLHHNEPEGPTNNTTLTLVVTNLKLPFWALQRLAVQVHTSMGRAIQPLSTQRDGDVLYAVTTGEVEDANMDPISLNMMASELAWDAVLNSVPKLPKLPEPLEKSLDTNTLRSLEGIYEFDGGIKLQIMEVSGQLKAQTDSHGGIYFNKGQIYNLIPAIDGLFIIDAPAKDVIKFIKQKNSSITGLTINPGPWHIEAKRQ